MTNYETRNDTRKFVMGLHCSQCARTTSKAYYRSGSDKVHCRACAAGGQVSLKWIIVLATIAGAVVVGAMRLGGLI